MKILNLFAGIGGNRKLWGDEHKVTAVEYNKSVANIYQEFYPKDKVIIKDAYKYLLKYYKEFDFIEDHFEMYDFELLAVNVGNQLCNMEGLEMSIIKNIIGVEISVRDNMRIKEFIEIKQKR